MDSSASANNLSTLELHHTFDFFSTPQLTLPLTGAPYYVRFSVLSDHKSTIAQFIEDEEEEKGESLAARTTRRSVGLESDDESDDESVASDMSDYHLHDAIVRLVGQFIGPSRVPLGTYIISAMDLMAATEMNEPVMLLDTNISTSTSLSITPLPFTARDCHDESVPMPTTMTKQYYIESSATSMVENLAESAFTNDVPRQMLEIFIGRVTRRHLQATLDLETFDAYYNQAQRCKRTGFYATLLNQIQAHGDQTASRVWMVAQRESLATYVDMLKLDRRTAVVRESRRERFKPSKAKGNFALRMFPTNCHVHN